MNSKIGLIDVLHYHNSMMMERVETNVSWEILNRTVRYIYGQNLWRTAKIPLRDVSHAFLGYFELPRLV